MFYENIPESFSLNIELSKNQIDEIKPALELGHQIKGGAIFCQFRPELFSDDQAFFSMEGSWFPPEFADKLQSVINEWRASRGIPAKDVANV